ncbi:MAG: hypothetical protein K8R11_12505 [Methanococcoides sp.]|nr:hypothetical protein [Methanococcoides sp.]
MNDGSKDEARSSIRKRGVVHHTANLYSQLFLLAHPFACDIVARSLIGIQWNSI